MERHIFVIFLTTLLTIDQASVTAATVPVLQCNATKAYVFGCNCTLPNGEQGIYPDDTNCWKVDLWYNKELTHKGGKCRNGTCVLPKITYGCESYSRPIPTEPPIGCAFPCYNHTTLQREFGYYPENTPCWGTKFKLKWKMKARIEDRVVYSPYPDIEIPTRSFYSLVAERLQINPEKLALVDDVLSLTRSDLLLRLQRYAVGFQRHGVLPGGRVCIHLSDSIENLVAMYACAIAGATLVMAKTSLTEYELRYQAKDSDSTHILTDVEFTEKVTKATASLGMKGFFSMGPAGGFVSAASFASLNEREFQECPVLDPESTMMAVCYTSGSTGMPKGVEITHYNFVSCFYTLREHMPWTDEEIFLSASPITHMSGLVLSIMPVLNGACSVIVPAKSTPGQVLDAIDKHKATVTVTFPTQLQSFVREMQRMGRQLPSLRHISIGGSVVTDWLADAARYTFGGLRTLQTLYGMTEACILVAAQPTDQDISQRGSDVGLPTTRVTFMVVDIETREKLGPHETGEICFRNATMVRGYYKRPKETAELFEQDGWMRSGDAGYYDEDGRLYFSERLKQMIKCMGNQVVPAELEELLLRKHDDEIDEVSVVGLPHSEYGEAAAAAVVLSEKGRQLDRSDLAERIKVTVKENLAVHKHLYGGVFFLESLPTTESLKVNRPALARFLLRAK